MRADAAAAWCPFVADGVHVLPVLHERLEYADLVRVAVDQIQPQAIAVEIPSSLGRAWLQAVDRLPAISVLLYENSLDQTIYLPVHPADPLVEAARMARERGLRLACADLDVDGYADYRDAVPDSYALWRLGPEQIYRSFQRLERPADPDDDKRESCMAYHARRLREEPASLGEVLPEIPFYVAAYELRRHELPAEPVEAAPRPAGRSYGPFRVLSGGRGAQASGVRDAVARGARAAEPGVPERPAGGGSASRPGPADRLRLQWALVREAEQALSAAAPDEAVETWQRWNLARFTRNLALSSGQLVADLFDLLSAARACVSDNFAWELHRLATAYPSQTGAAADLPTARIRADELYDGTRRIRLQRLVRRAKRPDWRSVLKRRRVGERWDGEWLEGFDGDAICSYPPEDLVIEEFGRYLKSRGKRVLSEERARSVPFTTSVLDGIDVRETIRHWTEHKIFVRELGRAPGGVGSVVVIFDEKEDLYPYSQTWLGEHDQESDMAFFSTEPAQAIVGPGICRVTYGGMLLSYPPRRMADVWTDADYRLAETKAETLLLAALDYSVERIVVHVAAKPPRGVLRQLAQRLGLNVLHLPIGTISPTTLKKIRVMHILSGHERRKLAKEYIW
jgi:hypothetical protein